MYIKMHKHTHIRTYIHTYIRMYVRTYVYTYMLHYIPQNLHDYVAVLVHQPNLYHNHQMREKPPFPIITHVRKQTHTPISQTKAISRKQVSPTHIADRYTN